MRKITLALTLLSLFPLLNACEPKEIEDSSSTSSEIVSFYDEHATNIDRVKERYEASETFLLLIHSKTCHPCLDSEVFMKDFLSDKEVSFYTILASQSGINTSTFYQEGVASYINQDQYNGHASSFEDNPTALFTPTFIMIKEGHATKMIVGYAFDTTTTLRFEYLIS